MSPVAEMQQEPLVRLNKFLADRGVASRRKCDELIAAGKVSIDGEPVVALGTKIDPTVQTVELDGIVIRSGVQRKRYYLLNKPRGVVCTNEPREARPRAIDLIRDRDKGRIYTVGRLDEDSQGLILLTSDGDFANLVAHPRHGVPKTYLVKLKGRIEPGAIAELRGGVRLAEGRTGPAVVSVERRTGNASVVRITLREGKNREVRRMFAAVGHAVLQLRRVRIGPLSDRRLKEGEWRPLTRREVAELVAVASDPRRSDELIERAAEPRRRRGQSEVRRRRARPHDPGRRRRPRRDEEH
jgi:pseudouridine synthase